MPISASPALAPEIAFLDGMVLDLDTHEHTPVNHWVNQFGPVAERLVDAATASTWEFGNEREDRDVADLTPENIWRRKRATAPSAFDFSRRDTVMAEMGVRKALVFPGGGGMVPVAVYNSDQKHFLPGIDVDRHAYARRMIDAYNDWALEMARQSSSVLSVAVLIADDVEGLIVRARDLARRGARCFWMPSTTPPGGLSPADRRLDPFWDILSSERIPLASHIGADGGFLHTDIWKKAEAFQGFRMGDEISLDPYTFCTTSWPSENFLMTLVLGGVFERFPDLAYMIAEIGADWVGPIMAKMDMWIVNSGVFNKKNEGWAMKRKPSEYVRSNVRVVPFYFEDVGSYLAKWREYGIEDVLCYGSDFPHREGGTDPMGDMARSILSQGLGEAELRKFFAENGKLIIRD